MCRRFVIVSNGRSGSTLLVDLLRSHPAIQCEGEILNERLWSCRRRLLLGLVRAYPLRYMEWRARYASHSIYGFKLKTGGQVYSLGRTLSALHRRGWRLIYLHRRDALQQTFSWTVAQVSGHWQTAADRPYAPRTITLDVDDFMQKLRSCVADRQALADLMRQLPHLPLVYEEHLQCSAQWPATSERICNWLDVVPAPLTTRLAKTWDRPYADVVTNYGQIVATVERSDFGYLVMASPNVSATAHQPSP